MKVNIVSGPFVNIKRVVRLTPHEPGKDPILVPVDNMNELSMKVKEVGAVEVETLGCIFVFKEAY